MDAIILCRVSDPRQKEEGISLPNQEKVLRDYCLSKQLATHSVHSFSESAYADIRKYFDVVLTEVDQYWRAHKKPVAIVVYKIDRISRRVRSKSLMRWDELRRAGKLVTHATSDGLVFDQHNNAMQNFTLNIALAMAQMHSDLGRERAIDSRKWLIENGLYYDHAPIGLLNDRDQHNKATLVIDPVRSPYIVQIFDLYSQGHNMEVIARLMREASMTTQSGGFIYRDCIHRIIRQPLYAGWIRNPDDGVLYPAHPKYPRIISKELWDMCQQNKRKPYSKTNRSYTFSSLITCGECGSPVHSYAKTKPNGKEYVYLRCAKTRGVCTTPLLSEKEAIAQVIHNLERFTIDQEFGELIMQEARLQLHEKHIAPSEIKALKKELSSLTAQEANLDDDRLNRLIDAQKYTQLLTKIQKRRTIVTDKLAEKQISDQTILNELKKTLDCCRDMANLFKSSPPSDQNDLLQTIVRELILHGKKLEFNLKEGLENLFLSTNSNWLPTKDKIKTLVERYIDFALA